MLACAALPATVVSQCTTTITAFPYDEGFEAAPTWISGGANSDWTWGVPGHPSINGTPDGVNAWCVGGLSGSFYTNNQQSWLEGPCFDLSLLTYPWISFWIYWETEPSYDGLGFQYSPNGGTTWINVGNTTDIDCLNTNWFNTPSITALNLAAPKRGWSGTAVTGGCATGQGSGTWVRATHCLDGLPTDNPVKFRFIFGAGSICNTFDGVGIDGIHIGEAPENVPQINFTCNGNTVNFNNTATLCAASSVWNFGDPGSGANNTASLVAATHTYPGPGTYPVSLTMTGPCNAPATEVVQVVIGELDVTSTDPGCLGNAGTATATVTGAPGPFQYDWTPGGQTTQSITGLAAGEYTVLVQAAGMCPVQGTAQLLPGASSISAAVSSTDVSCNGLTDGTATVVPAGGSGIYTFAWAPSGGIGATATGLAAGAYSCTINDDAGCTFTANVTLLEPDPISLTLPPDPTICEGSSLTLSATAEGGTGAFTYAWSPDGPNVEPISNTTYTVVATDANGCASASNSVFVEVSGTITPSFSVETDQVCIPVCATFTDLSVGDGERAWSFGDGATAGDTPSPVHCYGDPGLFDVTLTITDAAGCVGTFTMQDAVEVIAPPVAAFDATPDVAMADSPNFQFIDQSSRASFWYWEFGDPLASTSEDRSPQFSYPTVGCYTVSLLVTNDVGCFNSTSAEVCVEDAFAWYVPNSFTPNNDGINDGFEVITTVRDPQFFEVIIFDRWGQEIATLNKPFSPWVADGVPQGVYVWRARIRDRESKLHELTGSVTLLR